MVSRRRLDDRPISRRGPMREPRRRILIVCEGRETERGYFEALQHAVRNPRVHVKVARETGAPATVVEWAIKLRDEAEREAKLQRDENIRWDEVWGVFDVDEHPNLRRTIETATAHAIEVAVSNPCFELWALLHFQELRRTSSATSCGRCCSGTCRATINRWSPPGCTHDTPWRSSAPRPSHARRSRSGRRGATRRPASLA